MKYIRQNGFSLVELMVALTMGLILLAGTMAIYMSQLQNYKTVSAQGSIQDEENAISGLLIPAIRSAGFFGCSSGALTTWQLAAGAPPPLGVPIIPNTSRDIVMGYDYTGTSGSGSAYTIAADNAANDPSAANWSPTLTPSLLGAVASGSDVLITLGAASKSQPVGVSSPAPYSASLHVNDASGFQAGQFGAISDCGKADVFQVIGPATASAPGTPGVIVIKPNLGNVLYSSSAQVIPVQENAFFVAQGQGGESVLMQATLQESMGGSYSWITSGTPAIIGVPLVPGVETMQVLYGIGANGVATQYVPAGAVTNWLLVDTVRIGFLLEGRPGSAGVGQNRNYTVLGTTFTVPADTRIRHVFEITINMRNAS